MPGATDIDSGCHQPIVAPTGQHHEHNQSSSGTHEAAPSSGPRDQQPAPENDEVDYGYEDHAPSPRHTSDFFVLPSNQSLGAPPCRRGSFCCPTDQEPSLDATEVSHGSPSSAREVLLTASSPGHHHHHHHQVTFSQANDYHSSSNCDPYYSPPASSHQKRRHNRRGGFVHGSLLRSAVMASMECPDEDDAVPTRDSYRQNSAISLQSLQDALRETSSLASSPRKRARRVCRTKSSSSRGGGGGGDPTDEEQATASSSAEDAQLGGLLTAMRMQDDPPALLPPARREPPVRRVSRKTSYDSRISEFSDWDEEEIWEGMGSETNEDDDDDSDSD